LAAFEFELTRRTAAVGDLHLDPAGDERSWQFGAWLERLAGDEHLIVLGDLFEVWVGPAQARLAGAAEVLDALSRATRRGVLVDVVPGNRDFLLGRDFAARTGAGVRPAGLVGTRARGDVRRFLFLHGDELCTRDRAYQRMKRVLRSAPVRGLSRLLPLPAARWAAGRLRGASVRAVGRKSSDVKALQPDACRRAARGVGADAVVCGHAHESRDERMEGGLRWIVVDAWGGERDLLAIGPEGELGLTGSGGWPG